LRATALMAAGYRQMWRGVVALGKHHLNSTSEGHIEDALLDANEVIEAELKRMADTSLMRIWETESK